MSKRTPIQRLKAAGNMFAEEPDNVSGYWRDYFIWVTKDKATDDWYLRVNHPDGCYLVDGWWKDSAGCSAADAVARAFKGACLLEGEQ
ncbi:hypothetical protein [Caballeronia sp. S22]|uniref:hypothetical protein n=1 Tax=Caballeronia sp. S22 TaxID=3137182 RepID=UPI003530A108